MIFQEVPILNHTQPRSGMPKLLPVLIIAILAGMYYYAAYVDVPSPDKTVDHFYQAYFDQDYDTVVQDLSVFWAVNLLPQYQDLAPAELLQKRAEIEQETSTVLKSFEENQPPEEGVSVEVLKDYTKTGEYSAIVVYQVMQQQQPVQKEVAFLIKEAGGYKIINFSPLDDSDLELINNYNLDQLDESFKELLGV